MAYVYCSTVIPVALSEVWKVIRDFNSHVDWHPAIAESRIENDMPPDRVGAVRSFQLKSGESLREQLIALSDRDHTLSYSIVESEIPLLDYVAHIELRPITDANHTFWQWYSHFSTPDGRETELSDLVRTQVYQAGFEALHSKLV